MKKYSEDHQWVEVAEDGTAKVGITQFAAEELGEITFVELPSVGKSFQSGEQLCVVESVKAASDVYAPAGGTVIAVNSPLEEDPSGLNEDPEGTAWLCQIKDWDAAALDKLMDAAAYEKYCRG